MVAAPRLAALLGLILLPAHAFAVSVFLNGTKVDGLANTSIEKCSVQFDAKANVQLNCPGYSVKLEGAESAARAEEPAPAPKEITRKYFLVTEQAVQGAAEFDIEVYLNSKFIRRLRSDDEQLVTDVTKYLLPGNNSVTFIAKKKVAGQTRRSFSPEHFFRVIIGEGNASADRVMIDNPVITFQKTAADAQDATQEFTLSAR